MTDDAVPAYVDGIRPEHRPLFDRIDATIRAAFPDVAVVLSYQMPTYVVGTRRLYVGAWKHGISLYGWSAVGTAASRPGTPSCWRRRARSGCDPRTAEHLTDDELREFVTAVLAEAGPGAAPADVRARAPGRDAGAAP